YTVLKANATSLSLLETAVSSEHVHLIEEQVNTFQAFQALKQHFSKDERFQRKDVHKKMLQIQYTNLATYISTFKGLVAEYQQSGGNREEETLTSLFLDILPDSIFRVYKSLFYETDKLSIDDAFVYF